MSDLYDGNRRRADDELDASFKQCPAYLEHDIVKLIHADLKGIKEELAKVAEVVEAWEDAKGFVKTIRTIGEIAKWIAVVSAACLAIWYLVGGKK
jgi:hypothetical protein